MMVSNGASTVSYPGSSGFDGLGLAAFFSLSGMFSSEAVSSEATSAIRYQRPERVGFAANVVPPLKLTDVERKIGFAHLMIVADDPALDKRPEAFDMLSVNRPDDILAFGVVNHGMGIGRREAAITDILISHKQADLFGNSLSHEAFEGRAVNSIDNLGDHLTGTADRANDGLLTGAGAASAAALEPLAYMPVLRLPPTKVSSTSTSPNSLPLGLFCIATRMRWHMDQAVS
jgi:hypothetical protein